MPIHQAKLFNSLESFENFKLKEGVSGCNLIDLLDQQIEDLCKTRNPLAAGKDLETKTSSLKESLGPSYGTYAYYSWSNFCVKILNKSEFIEVRTSRNKFKITNEEMDKLSQKNIVVIGMSVGKAVAELLCLERVCGTITLVDFDVLETSNMNRIMASLSNVNEFKAIITAREIAEFDPYLNINVNLEGINSSNIQNLLSDNKSTSLVVEVCDSLEMKVKVREYCKQNKIPVLMDTSDRGMIDIERFDSHPDLPIFHGRLKNFDFKNFDFDDQSNQQKLLSAIVNLENISERAKFSLSEIGKTIRTWPQLASSVYLGAAATVFAARNILLEEHIESGRYYIDLEKAFKKN